MTHAKKNEVGFDLKSNDIRLLAAIGFASARSGLAEQSRKIFEGLASVRPQSAFPYIGLAMASLCVGEPERAASILRNRGLPNCPDDLELRVWLAIALKYSGQSAHAALICKSLEGQVVGRDFLQNYSQSLAGLVVVTSGDMQRQQQFPSSIAAVSG